MTGNGAIKLAIVGAIVALICVMGIVVTVLALGHGFDSNSTPVITTVLGVIGTTVTALLALLAVVGVDKKVNGHIERLTNIATTAAADSGNPDIVREANAAADDASKLVGKDLPHAEDKK